MKQKDKILKKPFTTRVYEAIQRVRDFFIKFFSGLYRFITKRTKVQDRPTEEVLSKVENHPILKENKVESSDAKELLKRKEAFEKERRFTNEAQLSYVFSFI